MSHQDDLEMKYQSASNDLPSELSDQIILRAAKDAVTHKKPRSNVVKGKFSSRKWHIPVSIAAAAVLTVSVVTSLQPWRIIPVNSPVPYMSEEPKTDRQAYKNRAKATKDTELKARTIMLTASTPTAQKQEAATVKFLTILEWLNNIEKDIRNDDVTKVKEKTLMLTKQHPLESFSEIEQDRFKIIQTYLANHK